MASAVDYGLGGAGWLEFQLCRVWWQAWSNPKERRVKKVHLDFTMVAIMVAVLVHVHCAARLPENQSTQKTVFTNVTIALFSKGLLQIHRM